MLENKVVAGSSDYWNKFISEEDFTIISAYDGWLDKYGLDSFNSSNTILELGCGWGDDTEYLSTLKAKVICSDFSIEALNIIGTRFPKVDTVLADISGRLPFDDLSIDCIVADLCLHYFSRQQMGEITLELDRIMKNNALLLCRVNSTKDNNYLYQKGIEIEKDFFQTKHGKKRLFNHDALKEAFSRFTILDAKEYELNKYPIPKIVWEIACRNSKTKNA